MPEHLIRTSDQRNFRRRVMLCGRRIIRTRRKPKYKPPRHRAEQAGEPNGAMKRRNTMAHKGQCFCGSVRLQATGEPVAMGYCHCASCRSWSGAPVNAFSLWKPEAVKVTGGAEHLASFQKTPASQRQYCAKCGGHLMASHPQLGLVDIFSATLPTLRFSPGVHVNYAETVLPMRDGLPKLKDFPAEFGGSGEIVAE
jgi:hypothetical protein